MLRLPLRLDDFERLRSKVRVSKPVLIVTSAAGAAALTATYPQVGLPLNVGVAVLGILYAITKDSPHAPSDSDED